MAGKNVHFKKNTKSIYASHILKSVHWEFEMGLTEGKTGHMTHPSRLPAFSCGVWNWFWVNRSSWNSFSICSPFTVCPHLHIHTHSSSSSYTMSTPLDFPRINLEVAFKQPLFRVPLIAGRLDKLSVLCDFLGSHLGLPLIGH